MSPAIGLKRKKAAHMAVQGEEHREPVSSPSVLRTSVQRRPQLLLEQPQRLLLRLRLLRRFG